MDLRVRRQSETAATLADELAVHAKVLALRYPTRSDHPQYDIAAAQMSGGGSLIAFELGSRRRPPSPS